MQDEVWKKVWDNVYEISNYGNVRRVWFVHQARSPSPIKRRLTRNGHERVWFFDKRGKRTTHQVALLVAEAFKGKRKPGLKVYHIDRNKRNNQVANLVYLTHGRIMQIRTLCGFKMPSTCGPGEASGAAKLSNANVFEIRRTCFSRKSGKRLKANTPMHVMAEKFGVTTGTVSRIVAGKAWKHLL